MTLKIIVLVPISLLLSSCFGPRNVDYKTVWKEQGNELKLLVKKIKTDGKFEWGNHDFPNNFSYPFDDGFHLIYGYDENSKANQSYDKDLTIKFYTDRGLLDHFSAFIYTNDTKEIEQLDDQVEEYNKNDEDVKLEEHWYYITE